MSFCDERLCLFNIHLKFSVLLVNVRHIYWNKCDPFIQIVTKEHVLFWLMS